MNLRRECTGWVGRKSHSPWRKVVLTFKQRKIEIQLISPSLIGDFTHKRTYFRLKSSGKSTCLKEESPLATIVPSLTLGLRSP